MLKAFYIGIGPMLSVSETALLAIIGIEIRAGHERSD